MAGVYKTFAPNFYWFHFASQFVAAVCFAAAAVLLLSDLGSRVSNTARAAKDRTLRVAILQHASQAILEQGRDGMIKGLKEKGWDFWTIEIENLSTELKGERDRLRKQQEQLDQRAALLATEAKELAKVRAEIEQVRKTISEKIVEVSADDAKNIATLAKTYTNLTPKAVVAIVRDLDDNTVVKILSLMKVDVVSPIFEEMSRSAGNDGGPLSKRVAIRSDSACVCRRCVRTTPICSASRGLARSVAPASPCDCCAVTSPPTQ
jgi:flagellar motility protein MotE (MotC chaperone)